MTTRGQQTAYRATVVAVCLALVAGGWVAGAVSGESEELDEAASQGVDGGSASPAPGDEAEAEDAGAEGEGLSSEETPTSTTSTVVSEVTEQEEETTTSTVETSTSQDVGDPDDTILGPGVCGELEASTVEASDGEHAGGQVFVPPGDGPVAVVVVLREGDVDQHGWCGRDDVVVAIPRAVSRSGERPVWGADGEVAAEQVRYVAAVLEEVIGLAPADTPLILVGSDSGAAIALAVACRSEQEPALDLLVLDGTFSGDGDCVGGDGPPWQVLLVGAAASPDGTEWAEAGDLEWSELSDRSSVATWVADELGGTGG